MKQDIQIKIDIEKLAHLAKLNISYEELSFLQKEMTDIINFASKVDVENEYMDANPGIEQFLINVLRDDKYKKSCSKEDLLSNSKRINEEYFCIPQIIE